MWRWSIAERWPKVRRFIERHPWAARAFAAYLILRWVIAPILLLWVAYAEGWLR